MARRDRAASGGWRHRDHTSGRLGVSLAVLALPLVATSLSGVVFQLVDLGFVSRLGEDATTAVIVTNQSIRQLLFMLVLGIGVGAQARVAQAIGAGDGAAADHAAGQALFICAALALLIAGAGLFAARPLLAAMQVAPEVLAQGVPYTRLVLLLAFGFVFGQVMAALLNGAGDSTTPMLISVIQTGVSLAAEWLLIFGRGGLPTLGIQGVAVGALVGQLLAVLLALRVLMRGDSRLHVRLRELRPDPAEIGALLRLSGPPAVQMMGGFLVTVLFLRLAGGFGGEAQAAYSIGLRLSMVGPMIAFPVAGACATLVGQNLGAGRVDRARAAVRIGLATSVTLLWAMAAGMFGYRVEILSAFAASAEVIRIGSELLVYQAGSFLAFAFYFVFLRSLQGAGDVAVPMGISLANSLGVTLPLGLWLSTEAGLGRGPTGIFQASFVGSVVVTLATGAWFASGRWQQAAGARPPRR